MTTVPAELWCVVSRWNGFEICGNENKISTLVKCLNRLLHLGVLEIEMVNNSDNETPLLNTVNASNNGVNNTDFIPGRDKVEVLFGI